MYLPILHDSFHSRTLCCKNVTLKQFSHKLLLIKPRIHNDFVIVVSMQTYTCFNIHLKNKIDSKTQLLSGTIHQS